MSLVRKGSDLLKTRTLARKAFVSGADVGRSGLFWNAAGRCERPVSVTRGGYHTPIAFDPAMSGEPKRMSGPLEGDKHPLYVDMLVPCRNCATCLRARARRWRGWITAETRIAPRTWFGTLTLRPEDRFKLRLKALRGRDHFENEADEFRSVHNEIGKEITKFLKRVRKGNVDHPGPHRFRYCLVTEAHSDGFPHYHAVIHEVVDLQPIRKELLRGCWHLGHSMFKLVENAEGAASYCAKYLSKSSLARVRASEDYGRLDGLTPKLPQQREPTGKIDPSLGKKTSPAEGMVFDKED